MCIGECSYRIVCDCISELVFTPVYDHAHVMVHSETKFTCSSGPENIVIGLCCMKASPQRETIYVAHVHRSNGFTVEEST